LPAIRRIDMTRRSPLSPEAKIARARIASMLAKKRGDLKRMPLSGKAALAAISAGKW
jgi:hypothetical protein